MGQRVIQYKEMKEDKKENCLRHTLYGVRVLMFMETEPQSNKYRQICLNSEDFAKVSKSYGIVKRLNEDGIEEVELMLSDEEYELPDLPEVYD